MKQSEMSFDAMRFRAANYSRLFEYKHPPCHPTIVDYNVFVDCCQRDGYMSKHDMLTELRSAGDRLEQYRAEMYHAEGDEGTDPDLMDVNPLYCHWYDELDAIDDLKSVSEDLIESQKKRKAEKVLPSSQQQQNVVDSQLKDVEKFEKDT